MHELQNADPSGLSKLVFLVIISSSWWWNSISNPNSFVVQLNIKSRKGQEMPSINSKLAYHASSQVMITDRPSRQETKTAKTILLSQKRFFVVSSIKLFGLYYYFFLFTTVHWSLLTGKVWCCFTFVQGISKKRIGQPLKNDLNHNNNLT